MERHIPLDGCLNFRDLGGYPTRDGRQVRWRRLFRSDALHRLSAADVRVLRGELELGTVVDLRSSGERRAETPGPLAAEDVRFHHVPLFDGDTVGSARLSEPMTLSDRYFALAEAAKEAVARVVEVLARSDRPALYHCAAGKDRTGLISAVLLGALGVRDEIIVADYALTRQNLDAIIERLDETEGYREMLSALPPDTLHAEPETMITLLDRMRERYGSMRGYLQSAGTRDATLQQLEEQVLTTAPSERL